MFQTKLVGVLNMIKMMPFDLIWWTGEQFSVMSSLLILKLLKFFWITEMYQGGSSYNPGILSFTYCCNDKRGTFMICEHIPIWSAQSLVSFYLQEVWNAQFCHAELQLCHRGEEPPQIEHTAWKILPHFITMYI